MKDSQPLARQHVGRIALGQFALDVVDEVGRVVVLDEDLARMQRLDSGAVVGGLADIAIGEHQAQHFIAPLLGELRMMQRVEAVGRAYHPGDRRHLADRQIARFLGEVELGGLPHAVDSLLAALPEVDVVDVVFQDLVLGILALGDIRHQDLLDLAPPVALAGQEKILHQLLGQGRAALAHAMRGEVHPGGFDDTDQVDAVMLVEAMVLGGEDRVDQRGRNLRKRYQAALLPATLENSAYQLRLELGREQRLAIERVAHREHRVARPQGHFDRFAREVGIGIGEAVQENGQPMLVFIERVLAARRDLAGSDAMVVKARQALEEAEVVEALARIDEAGIRVDARGDIPALAGKPRDDFVLQCVVVAQEFVDQRRQGEEQDRRDAEQDYFERAFHRRQYRSAPRAFAPGAYSRPRIA